MADVCGSLGPVCPFAEFDGYRPHLDDVAVVERRWPVDTFTVDERAVGAPEVGQHRAFCTGDSDLCVAARHAGVIEPDLRPWIPADDRVAFSERECLALPRQPETAGWALSSGTAMDVRRPRAEGVADAVHSPDEARLLRVVAQRPPDLADQHVEIAFDDEDIRPDLAKE